MSERTEILRIKTILETGDAEKAAKRIEKLLENIDKAADKAKGGKHGKGGDSNFAMGMRDLAEGRGVNAMQRFGHAIGATAGRLVVYMAAIRAAGAAVRWFREEVGKTDTAHDRLQATFEKTNRADRFSSSAEGPESLSKRIQEKLDQEKAEVEQQSSAKFLGDSQHRMLNEHFGLGNMRWGRGLAQGYQAGRDFFGLPTHEDQQHSSEQRGLVAGKSRQEFVNQRSQSYADQARIAKLNGPGNNPLDAKKEELEVERKLAIVKQKAEPDASPEDLKNLKERYNTLRSILLVEEEMEKKHYNDASSLLGIEGSNASKFQRGASANRYNTQRASSLLTSGLLNTQQRRTEQLNQLRYKNERRDMLSERYLQPDGRRRRWADVQRDFRNDRNSARRSGRFFNKLEADGGLMSVHRGMNGQVLDGIDPFTRQRVLPGIGPNAFPRKMGPGGAAKEGSDFSGGATLKDIVDALKEITKEDTD
jgi:hypothetical protein